MHATLTVLTLCTSKTPLALAYIGKTRATILETLTTVHTRETTAGTDGWKLKSYENKMTKLKAIEINTPWLGHLFHFYLQRKQENLRCIFISCWIYLCKYAYIFISLFIPRWLKCLCNSIWCYVKTRYKHNEHSFN